MASHLRQIRRATAAIVAGAGIATAGIAVGLNDGFRAANPVDEEPPGSAPAVSEQFGSHGWLQVEPVRRTKKPPQSSTEAS